MREQEVILKNKPDRPALRGHVFPRGGVFEHLSIQMHVTRAKWNQSGNRPQKRSFARPVRAEQSNHLALPDVEDHVEIKGTEREADGGVKAHATSQRSRSPTKTTSETSSSTRLKMKDASWLVSSRR